MRRVWELEAWSTPSTLLPADYGKDLAEELHALGVPRDLFLGLGQIPTGTDLEILRCVLERGELTADDFETFCARHALPRRPDAAESACKFLEYSLGRCLAWIHLPENSPPAVLQGLIEILGDRGHILVDPHSGERVSAAPPPLP